NTYGQLGTNSLDDRTTPSGDVLTNVQAIAAGELFTCALTTAGAVLCWGDDTSGQLAHPMSMELPEPLGPIVPLSLPAKAIAAGDSHACAVPSDNSVECWGNNTYGQLGDGTTLSTGGRATPAKVVGLDASCP